MRKSSPSAQLTHFCPPPGAASCVRGFLVLLGLVITSIAGAAQMPQPTGRSFLARYQARVSATQAEQPHWVTPLVTVTPRLEQEVRSDFVRQTNTKLENTWNFGNSKGLEIIPQRHLELLFNFPPFIAHQKGNDGFGDVCD